MNRQPKILCVDDEAIYFPVFEAVWEPHGYQTVLVQSGHDALATLRRERIDLVILDVVMPGMNGFEVCGLIKRDEALRHIPVG